MAYLGDFKALHSMMKEPLWQRTIKLTDILIDDDANNKIIFGKENIIIPLGPRDSENKKIFLLSRNLLEI